MRYFHSIKVLFWPTEIDIKKMIIIGKSQKYSTKSYFNKIMQHEYDYCAFKLSPL